MKLTFVLCVLAIASLASVCLFFARNRKLQPYLSRSCQGAGWLRAFPGASAQDVRSFLDTFCHAFGFSSRHLLRFSPQDVIMQIYRANNPMGGVDSLELESWVIALQRQYGFSLERVWHPELTLGGIFALVRSNAP